MTRSNIDSMVNIDVPGWDYQSVPGITNSFDCQHSCQLDDKCRSWTFVSTREVNNNCFLKTGIPYLQYEIGCTSGVKNPYGQSKKLVWVYVNRTFSQQNPGASRVPLANTLWLDSSSPLSNQLFLQLNIFIDHSIIEVFESHGGRIAITTRVYPEDDTANHFAVYVNSGPTTNENNIIINALDFWNLTSIWT